MSLLFWNSCACEHWGEGNGFRDCGIVGYSPYIAEKANMVPMRNLGMMLNKHQLVAEFFSSNG